MSDEIGSLVIKVGSDVVSLNAGMRDASKSVGEFSLKSRKDLTSVAKNIAKVGAAAVAAGSAIIGSMVKSQLSVIDAQAKMAQQLDTTSKSMATLKRAGDLSGVTIENISTASRTLSIRIGEAEQGLASAEFAFEQLNIDAKTLSDLPLDQRIDSINKALIQNVPASQRAAIAADLFGSRAATAMKMLDSGTLEQARKDTEDFGLALSDIDAKQVEMANDAMSSISMIVKGIAQQITVELAPILKVTADLLTTNAREFKGFGDTAEESAGGIVKVIGFLADAFEGVRRVFQIVANGIIKGFSDIKADALASILSIAEAVDMIPTLDMSNVISGITSSMNEARSVSEQAAEAIHNAFMEPLPSEAFKQMVIEAKAAASEIVQSAGLASPAGQIGGGLSSEDDNTAEKNEAALEAIKNRYMTEQELLRAHQEEMLIIGEEWDVLKFETEAQWRAVREQAEQEHADNLFSIRQKGLTAIEKFQSMSMGKQLATVTGALASMTAGVAQENRKMFELNKAAGIANAIVNAYQGISMTLATYPAPLSFAMAAVQGVAAFAQINAIRSASFSGGGGAAPSIAGSTAAPPTSNVSSGSPSAQGGSVMRVEGIDPDSLFTGSMVERLSKELLDFQKDGGEVMFA